VLLNSERLGQGPDELGTMLMGAFLKRLWVSERKSDSLFFYNSSVRLLAKGSPVQDAVEGLARAGVDVIACAPCVGHYALEGKLAAGRLSTMQEAFELMMGADKVITP
jgi:sulfur relay (sulfurtransferase) complex TusBCD TusD component (DsrE family)